MNNSNKDFVKADFEYKNLQIIESEYPSRGNYCHIYIISKISGLIML